MSDVESVAARTRAVYEDQIRRGTYSARFVHEEADRAFFHAVMDVEGRQRAGDASITVLDCGCGAGDWLEFIPVALGRPPDRIRRHGFDLTPGMVALTRERTALTPPGAEIRVGDVTDASSYVFADDAHFDVVFAWDVVQQVSTGQQYTACLQMARATMPGGVAIVFDHDARSPYGLRMGVKKAITRWLRVPLVPRFYLQARYPSLGSIRRRLHREGFTSRILVAPNGRRRALVIRRGP